MKQEEYVMNDFGDGLDWLIPALLGVITILLGVITIHVRGVVHFDLNKELEYRRNRERRLLEEEQQRECPHAYPPEESGANSVKSACEYSGIQFYGGWYCKLCSKQMSDREMKLHRQKMNYWTENVRKLRKKYKEAQKLQRKSEKI